MENYLRPKVRTGDLSRRSQQDGQFRNPPMYTHLGGFASADKWENPSGKRMATGPNSLERGGPQAVKGKPI